MLQINLCMKVKYADMKTHIQTKLNMENKHRYIKYSPTKSNQQKTKQFHQIQKNHFKGMFANKSNNIKKSLFDFEEISNVAIISQIKQELKSASVWFHFDEMVYEALGSSAHAPYINLISF